MRIFTRGLRALLPSILACSLFPLAVFADSDDLKLTVYCTAGSAHALLVPEARAEALETLTALGVSGIIIETRRGDSALTESESQILRDYFLDAGLRVSGGIATVPGAAWGERANEGLAWLNYESAKTQSDLEASIRAGARVFDQYVVDDFLLSGDKSAASDAARQGRTWGAYRRDLLVDLSERAIIAPAREENPDIHVVLKFPQSYDRYHEFGYDVARQPQQYDAVWVGTETRGQYTQRFGFTQPYQGFVNYRWIDSLSNGKLEAAWFDHGDCDGPDFVEQAWQTVLAGAREIVLFNYADLASSHPGDALLRRDYDGLAKLARHIREQPVTGIAAYKPPNSDPVSDMYILDFIGMLGIPVVPVSSFPEDSGSLFIPAYGAKDAAIAEKVEAAVAAGRHVIVTTGLLSEATGGDRLARLAGLGNVPTITPLRTETVRSAVEMAVPRGLDLGGYLDVDTAEVLLEALVEGHPVPYLTTQRAGEGQISVLNIHMFTQEDFDVVNEVLLPPRNLGLLDIPQAWANTLRQHFGGGGEVLTDAPTRVTIQPMGDAGWFIQNYNNTPAQITLGGEDTPLGALRDGFSGEPLLQKGNIMQRSIPARSRLWVAR